MESTPKHPRAPQYSLDALIAVIAIAGIAIHLSLHFGAITSKEAARIPLFVVLSLGGVPLIWGLIAKLVKREFGADLLAGISIVTSAFLGEYLAGALVVLMLSGGAALERFAVLRASSVLQALAKRMPNIAHRRLNGQLSDISLDDVRIGDVLTVLPHDICPVDGEVIEGHGAMDEAYLTGEPYTISKTPGSVVLSGAINGESALTIKAAKLPVDSRYAKIVEVMRRAEDNRPRMRRLADRLGAFYTPLALAVAVLAWIASADPVRFLAVLVVATPCPLLIAIPVAIIGSISLAAKRGIIIRDPSVLEQVSNCTTVIFDKTGTLTYGEPQLTDELVRENFKRDEILRLVASLEQYSKHPLARAVLRAAEEREIALIEANQVSEPPSQGLTGEVDGKRVQVTKRSKLSDAAVPPGTSLPPPASGLECVVLIDGAYSATYRFRDAPRTESRPFIQHLGSKHGFRKVMLVSGDRQSEVQYLADTVGIPIVHAGMTPEQKVAIVKEESKTAKTLFLGDGINDAPALLTATVGVAFGQNSDVTAEAAGAVIMTASLAKVDEFFHISGRMRRIALQSALGGMALSIAGMGVAAFGLLPPVAGAITQEIIDVAVILNALRVAIPPKSLIDFE
ncbi:MAG: heavy metal translocating P-type ATPase [Candidatus Hydrogenedentota bacterium]